MLHIHLVIARHAVFFLGAAVFASGALRVGAISVGSHTRTGAQTTRAGSREPILIGALVAGGLWSFGELPVTRFTPRTPGCEGG